MNLYNITPQQIKEYEEDSQLRTEQREKMREEEKKNSDLAAKICLVAFIIVMIPITSIIFGGSSTKETLMSIPEGIIMMPVVYIIYKIWRGIFYTGIIYNKPRNGKWEGR